MLAIIFLALNIITTQLIGAWLRYLPFSPTMSRDEIKVLWSRLTTWSLIAFVGYCLLIDRLGVEAFFYKMTLILGWLPYFLIALKTIEVDPKLHVFALGMQILWVLMLHTLVVIINNFVLKAEVPLPIDILVLHNVLYLTMFFVLIGLERKMFLNILPAKSMLEDQFSWYAASMPMAIVIGIMFLMADGMYPHGLREQFSRLVIPLFFFLVYRSMSISTRQIDERNRRAHDNERIARRLEELRNYNLIMQEHQRRLEIFRHDRRHNYRLISAMLDEGDVQAAIDHVEAQDHLLVEH